MSDPVAAASSAAADNSAMEIDGGDGERLPLTSAHLLEEDEAIKESFERTVKSRKMALPTKDEDVRALLRHYGEPVTYFAEDKASRRERLRGLMTEHGDFDAAATAAGPDASDESGEGAPQLTREAWFHEGSGALVEARREIAVYSLERARDRLVAQRRELATTEASKRAAEIQTLHRNLKGVTNYCSQIGDTRPLSFCEFSPDATQLASGGFTGLVKLWSVPDCTAGRTLRGHGDRVGGVVWEPSGSSTVALASCAADGSLLLWDHVKETPLHSLSNLGCRVARVAFHPSGHFLGASCFDQSWRLIDLRTQTELLHQEGHSREVYGLAFHRDGSLVATSGLDGYGRIWDLRTGRCVSLLEGHIKSVLAIDFSPDGHHVATGSEDHTARIWDLRQNRTVYTLPAHTSLVSAVKYEQTHGRFLVTASYDREIRAWASPTWAPLKALVGHDGKVMAVDIARGGKYIASASYDCTLKMWSAPDS